MSRDGPAPGPWQAGRPRLGPAERAALGELLRAACGVVLGEDLALVAERRLGDRVQALGLSGFAAYARFLAHDPGGPAELERAVELLVPHETYFFREPAQLECLRQELLPALLEANTQRRELSLWSAGCASGEEAYTLAMLLGEAPGAAGWRVQVVGTDLSAPLLEHARHAEYGPGSLRATSEARRRAFFEPLGEGRVRVRPPWREAVRFERANLLDAQALAGLPTFDLILCRNVLMYFDQPTRRLVVERFHQHLAPGGTLLLGHSENLLTFSTPFQPVQLQGDLVYRRVPR